MSKKWSSATGPVVGSLLLVSCGNGGEATPSAEELSEVLMTADDLDGGWSIFTGPQGGDEEIDPSGILTDEQRELLPSFDLCDAASDEAREIAQTLRPVVFRQMNLTVDDEINPPFDRTGHLIFAQQFLYSAEADEIERSFESLEDGMIVCLGETPAGEEGPGFSEELAVPGVGDDRFGVLTTIEEAGGWAEWRIQEALVRDGSVLMKVVVVDIRAGADPYFSDADFGEIVRTATLKLSSV